MIGRPFEKGQSGNPGGRPKVVAEVRELARQRAPEAIAALVQIMTEGKSEAARVAAATALLDRGWGKPTQPIAGDDEAGPVRIARIERVIVPLLEHKEEPGQYIGTKQ